jgi:hypothetical protein
VFFAVRMDSPDVRMKIHYSILERASQDRLFQALRNTPLFAGFADIGRLRWRIVMIAVAVIVLFVPLRRSLLQLRDETVARTAVRETIRSLAPAGDMLLQQVDVTPDAVLVRLVMASAVDEQAIEQAEKDLIRRTGKNANITVRRVVGAEELATFRQQMAAPALPPPPAPRSLNETRMEIIAQIDQPLREIWPSDVAPLVGYEVVLNSEDIILRIRYQSARPVDISVAEMVSRILQVRLAVHNLRLLLEREGPPRPSSDPRVSGNRSSP